MTAQRKPVEELRMKEKDFDRIMGQVLRIKAEPKVKAVKAKKPRKKASAGK